VKRVSFDKEHLGQVTVYVLLVAQDSKKTHRYFIAKNRDLAKDINIPLGWKNNAFMKMKAV